MQKIKILFIACFFIGCNDHQSVQITLNTYDFYEKCRRLVLSERQPGLEFDFSRGGAGVDKIVVTYLGDVITSKDDTLRVINSVNYSGQLEGATRGSGNVFIYDAQNKNLGHYYVGSALSVPSKIDNSSLVFNYKNESCNQSTTISLKDSIPKEIFIKCTERGGDIYSFLPADN